MPLLRSREYYVEEFEKKKRGIQDIAEECQTYPNRIRRELQRYGFKLPNKSEAQKRALKSGRHKHPTKGIKRDEATRVKISQTMSKNWEGVTPEERERRSNLGKAQWENMSELEKVEFRKASMDAVRETSKSGSKLENFLYKALLSEDIEVSFHSEHLLLGTKLQTDLYVPSHKLVIEIDGPSHYFPIWGEKSLARNQVADKKKNDMLINFGYVMVRVKALMKTVSEIHKRQLLSKVLQVLQEVGENFPPPEQRLIEIEIGDHLWGDPEKTV